MDCFGSKTRKVLLRLKWENAHFFGSNWTMLLCILYYIQYWILLRTAGNNCCCYNDSTKIWPKSSAQFFVDILCMYKYILSLNIIFVSRICIGPQWAQTQKKKSNFNTRLISTFFEIFSSLPLSFASGTLHSNKFQKTLISVFEANSALSCQNGLFYAF